MSKTIKVFNCSPLKGWEYKDDRKLFKYVDSKVKLSGLLQVQSLIGLFNHLAKKEKSLQSQGIANIRKQTVQTTHSRLSIIWALHPLNNTVLDIFGREFDADLKLLNSVDKLGTVVSEVSSFVDKRLQILSLNFYSCTWESF